MEYKKVENPSEYEDTLEIRETVFIHEQGVDKDLEYDGLDDNCEHFIAKQDEKSVACCRVRRTEKGLKLERFAVLLPYRNQGIGEALLNFVFHNIDHKSNVYLNAQIQVEEFYAKYGFKRSSDVFEEANIEHVQMTLAQ